MVIIEVIYIKLKHKVVRVWWVYELCMAWIMQGWVWLFFLVVEHSWQVGDLTSSKGCHNFKIINNQL